MTFKAGNRVRYIAKIVPALHNKVGKVTNVDHRGWIEVDFDGVIHKCAEVSLELVDPRLEAVQLAFDSLTEYFADHCPDDVNFEDFDAELDGIRAQLGDLILAA